MNAGFGSFAEFHQQLIFADTKRRLPGSNLPFDVLRNQVRCSGRQRGKRAKRCPSGAKNERQVIPDAPTFLGCLVYRLQEAVRSQESVRSNTES
jgi:hypothetical protein